MGAGQPILSVCLSSLCVCDCETSLYRCSPYIGWWTRTGLVVPRHKNKLRVPPGSSHPATDGREYNTYRGEILYSLRGTPDWSDGTATSKRLVQRTQRNFIKESSQAIAFCMCETNLAVIVVSSCLIVSLLHFPSFRRSRHRQQCQTATDFSTHAIPRLKGSKQIQRNLWVIGLRSEILWVLIIASLFPSLGGAISAQEQ